MTAPQQPAWTCACGCGWPPPPGCLWVPGHVLPGPPPARRRGVGVAVGAVAGLVVLVGVALAGTGGEPPPQRTATRAPAAAVAVPPAPTAPAQAPVAAPAQPAVVAATTAPPRVQAAATPKARSVPPALLQPAGDGDGDSWHDTAGREYRLGLINTPERGACFGSEATAERKALVARGFRATSYATDDYGRAVSVVTTARGVNVNVHLARRGFADDRYLARFRHENPALAAELDRAFAAAKAEGAGLWSACASGDQAQGIAAPAPPAPAADCHPDYATCIPRKGDGSGRGEANDLDCGDLSGPVRLRQAGVDPYRLDADGDGVGCD